MIDITAINGALIFVGLVVAGVGGFWYYNRRLVHWFDDVRTFMDDVRWHLHRRNGDREDIPIVDQLDAVRDELKDAKSERLTMAAWQIDHTTRHETHAERDERRHQEITEQIEEIRERVRRNAEGDA